MRCGFCNLFTTVRPEQDLVARTLQAIERQSEAVAAAIQPQGIAQAAFGGGTPSFLSESQLEKLFATLQKVWPVSWGDIPVSFEASPGTVTAPKLALLKSLGVDRLSLGVQSFLAEDLAALRRPQPAGEIERACGLIAEAGFAVRNLDLIYGIPGQEAKRWQESLHRALQWKPEELYLYPLYVGKLTRLDRLGGRPGEARRSLYRQARDRLLGAGYAQISMRLFRLQGVSQNTDYCCQEDGMVGLGPGARSYTRELHYSSEYAVGSRGVRSIIQSFQSAEFSQADYGVRLDLAEQKRRYLIKSLLRVEGVDQKRLDDFPQLEQLLDLGLADLEQSRLRLNEEGLAWTDTIGPWLYSEAMNARMESYQLT
jgi:oxygen-independent coproporphyrinogen-3 oxidase